MMFFVHFLLSMNESFSVNNHSNAIDSMSVASSNMSYISSLRLITCVFIIVTNNMCIHLKGNCSESTISPLSDHPELE